MPGFSMKYLNKKNLAILALVIIFTLSFFLDKSVLAFFQLITNNFLNIIMEFVSNIGSIFVVMIFITIVFMWETKRREYISPLWLSFISATVISFLLKAIIARPRPFFAEGIPLVSALGYSFPSAHVAVVFSVLPIINKEFPRFKWYWLIFSVVVALSRVYLQVHYLSDVIAGALLGYGIGYAFLILEKRRKPFKRIFEND